MKRFEDTVTGRREAIEHARHSGVSALLVERHPAGDRGLLYNRDFGVLCIITTCCLDRQMTIRHNGEENQHAVLTGKPLAHALKICALKENTR